MTTCPDCGGPLPKPATAILCLGGGQGGTLELPPGPCRSPECRQARDDAALADAIARGVIDP